MSNELTPLEILKKVKKIEISVRGYVHELFSGEYHSVFKGQGMEFAEVREYSPGDDIRAIDWNVTARMNHPYIKQFNEERELSVFILFDASMSQHFGTKGNLKKNMGIELAGVLASAALLNNDKVGMILFTDKVEKLVAVRKGKKHIFRLIRDLVAFEPEHRRTSIREALEYTHKLLKKKSTIFLISDFWDSDFEAPLKILSRKHDVVGVHILDPFETQIPKDQLLKLVDPETGRGFIVDTYDEANYKAIYEYINKHHQYISGIFNKSKIDRILLKTDEDFVVPLIRFFKSREKRFH
ncbi:MAG: DUF58 domain-containing protein [Calditrichia bacterium]